MNRIKSKILIVLETFFLLIFVMDSLADVSGWLNWRGPEQNGVSQETNLPDSIEIGGENHLWTYDLSGRGTPVIAEDRLYAWGYDGEGQELHEVLVCLNTATGMEIWKKQFSDFISDIIYNRYSIGSPTVDAETGNVFLMTTPGLLVAFDPDGNHLWERSMMEEFGRLTFPNGRTGAPVIEENLVIVRGITTNWGKQGPARDRFYAFEKDTGELVWASTPGVRPTDSSFSTPVFSWLGETRVFYCGTGCGNIVCVNVRTGEPISRFQLLHGGVNSSVVLHENNTVIAIHGKENIDTSEIGRMVALRMDILPSLNHPRPLVLQSDTEKWRNPLGIFTSSPVLVKDRIYQVTHTGELSCVNVASGEILWDAKLSNSQLHASPLFADGKLYVPMRDGSFHILKPSQKRAEVLSKVQLEGNCLGSPSVWNGRFYVHTTEKLYCFGNPGSKPLQKSKSSSPKTAKKSTSVKLQIIPAEVLLFPGDKKTFKVGAVDDKGHSTTTGKLEEPKWQKFIPPAAKVRSRLNAKFTDSFTLQADPENVPSAGMFKASVGDLSGFIRGRILPKVPYQQNFEDFELNVAHKVETDVHFAFPPLPWIGARFKWEVRELEGNKVLTKTLDRVLFQRAITFIGIPAMKDYTLQVDVRTEGNRRIMSTVGVINQRYIIALKGNWQLLEVSSNHDILKVSVPFQWKPNTWYRLKTKVQTQSDGSTLVLAKAWNREENEPDNWTIEVPHTRGHLKGSPGLFGFSPQSKKQVYIDNILLEKNQ